MNHSNSTLLADSQCCRCLIQHQSVEAMLGPLNMGSSNDSTKTGWLKGKPRGEHCWVPLKKKGVLALVTFGTTSRIYCLDARHLIWSWWILAWELDETFLPSMPPCLVSRSTRSKWLLLAARNSSVSSCCRSHGASRIMSNKKLHEKAAVVHGQWMTCRRPQNDIQTQTSLS